MSLSSVEAMLAAKPLAWLRAYCPVGTIGGTILLYRFATPPVAGPVPDAPAHTCPGSVSRRVG